METDNPFKQALQSGQRQIGLWLSMANPYCAEMCASCGFDWVLIDGEHSPNDLNSILGQLQAIASYPTHAVVRPPVGETWLIKQLLDLGATSLLVPMVDTAEQARQLVQAVRYPPHGVRGVGSRLARVSQFGAQPDYIKKANDRICLLVQIESRLGLENLVEIAAVDGVDGVFIGPSDLSASMGLIGQPGHPEVQAAIAGAIKRIAAAGKPSGILSLNTEDSHRYVGMGVCFVAVGGDIAILTDGARELAKQFK
ncbi:4-hydroxy-2-oxoheptanedioate aldolase [Bordetella sp. BOR01]|uniref:4-hydroxy-2-oxoheptanedioate aldolase n=1 Tax=Bordetella sp. BOR01 TaxID=2854779 RepID=UPI001C492DD8|nr:4-hydroxy-2-oxoheptanedioate aldolase [Bordetella sp. BOR01]MBV7481495.1 4-hydroxy-2-oxoheptanedioate aldolase [Bordetella sp. BOR01]